MNESACTESNGTGVEREILRYAKKVSMEHQNLSVTATVALAKEAVTSLSTVVAASEKEERAKPSSPTKLEASVTTLKSLSPDEVKDRTGFTNIVHLLQPSVSVKESFSTMNMNCLMTVVQKVIDS